MKPNRHNRFVVLAVSPKGASLAGVFHRLSGQLRRKHLDCTPKVASLVGEVDGSPKVASLEGGGETSLAV